MKNNNKKEDLMKKQIQGKIVNQIMNYTNFKGDKMIFPYLYKNNMMLAEVTLNIKFKKM